MAGGGLIYLLYGVYSGYVPRAHLLPPLYQGIIMHKVAVASRFLIIGFLTLFFLLLLRFYASLSFAIWLLIAGGAFYYGFPLLFTNAGIKQAGILNAGMETLLGGMRSLGEWFFFLGGMLLLIGVALVVYRKATAFPRAPETPLTRVSHRPSLLSRIWAPCWETPYCREFLRDLCPIYEQRKSCWKVGKGCFCDEDIISHLFQMASTEDKRLRLMSFSREEKSPKRRCAQCFIYLEHQRQKYRLFAPLTPLAVLALFWLGKDGIHAIYLRSAEYLDSLISGMAYLPSKGGKVVATLTIPWLETMILAIIALLLIGLLLRLLEYWVFTLKW